MSTLGKGHGVHPDVCIDDGLLGLVWAPYTLPNGSKMSLMDLTNQNEHLKNGAVYKQLFGSLVVVCCDDVCCVPLHRYCSLSSLQFSIFCGLSSSCFLAVFFHRVQVAFDADCTRDCALRRYLQQAPNARAMLLQEFKLTLHAETPELGPTRMSPLLIDGDPCEADNVHIKILHRSLQVYSL